MGQQGSIGPVGPTGDVGPAGADYNDPNFVVSHFQNPPIELDPRFNNAIPFNLVMIKATLDASWPGHLIVTLNDTPGSFA